MAKEIKTIKPNTETLSTRGQQRSAIFNKETGTVKPNSPSTSTKGDKK